MPTIQEIERLTEAYAIAMQEADDLRLEVEEQLARTKRMYMARLRRRAAKVKDARAALLDALKEGKELFARPKTRVFHGVKVGYRKQPGAIKWDDEEKVIAKIKSLCADQTDVLIKTTEKPAREALELLPADTLKKLGIKVVDTGDVPIIKSTIGDLEKLFDSWMEDVVDEKEAADVVL